MTLKTPLIENQTGIAANPTGAAELRKASATYPPTSTGSKFMADKVRVEYAQDVEQGDLGYGSIPDPLDRAAMAKAKAAGLLPDRPELYFDKLGERMAFERMGVRFYEALISKHEAFGSWTGGPSREDLVEILNEEHRHFSMLEEVIVQLGGDPTAITPSANLVGVVGKGVHHVAVDPRTTLVQGLEALLVAELADYNGWKKLIAIASTARSNALVLKFQEAERREEQHVEQIKDWLAAAFGVQRPT